MYYLKVKFKDFIMKVLSIILFAVCFVSINAATAQKKSCSKADMAKCAKAMDMSLEEVAKMCAKKCPMAGTSAYLAKTDEGKLDVVPVSLTADQQTKVASAMQSKESGMGKVYQCKKSKASCAKSKASSNVATLKSEAKKKAARA